jgi:hypothetical protein
MEQHAAEYIGDRDWDSDHIAGAVIYVTYRIWRNKLTAATVFVPELFSMIRAAEQRREERAETYKALARLKRDTMVDDEEDPYVRGLLDGIRFSSEERRNTVELLVPNRAPRAVQRTVLNIELFSRHNKDA